MRKGAVSVPTRTLRRLSALVLVVALLIYGWGILASHLTAFDQGKVCVGSYSGAEVFTLADVVRVDASFVPLRFECFFTNGAHQDIATNWANWMALSLILLAACIFFVVLKRNRHESTYSI